MDTNSLLTRINEISQTCTATAQSSNVVSDALHNIGGLIVGIIGFFCHHIFLLTLAVRFCVVAVTVGILWHVGWIEFCSMWSFLVSTVLLIGLGAIAANVGKGFAFAPFLLPLLILVDGCCFWAVVWFIPGLSSVRPIAAPVMYGFVLFAIQIPLSFVPA